MFQSIEIKYISPVARTSANKQEGDVVYIVQSDQDSNWEDAKTARLPDGTHVLEYGEPAPWNPAILATDIEAVMVSDTPVQNLRVFEVSVSLASEDFADIPPGEDPLAQPAEIAVSYEVTRSNIDRDITGKAIINTAGFPFDPPAQREFHDRVVRVTQYQSTYSFGAGDYYEDTVNADDFMGWPPQSVLCTGISANRISGKFGNLIRRYWRVSGIFKFRRPVEGVNPRPWQLRLINQSKWAWKVDDNDVLFPAEITTIKGIPITWFLNPDGSVMPIEPPAEGEPGINYVDYSVREARNFSEMNFRL